MRTQNITRAITWSVPSATQKGVSYEVTADVEDGRLRCNCLAGVHDKACWHVKAVASGLAGKPRVRISQRPAAPAPAFRTTTRRRDVVMDGLRLPDEGMPRGHYHAAPPSEAGRDLVSMLEV